MSPIPLSTHQSPRTYLRATSPVPSRTVGMQANNRPTWTSPGGTWDFPTGYGAKYSDYSPQRREKGEEGRAQRQCIVSMPPLLPAELSLFAPAWEWRQRGQDLHGRAWRSRGRRGPCSVQECRTSHDRMPCVGPAHPLDVSGWAWRLCSALESAREWILFVW